MAPGEILNEQWAFYQELYRSDQSICFQLENTSQIKIPHDLKKQLDTNFSKDEITSAVHQLARNKTPGLSGLTADFFKVFCNNIGDVFYELVIAMYKKNECPL